jgi:hypothetical protein
MVDLAYWAVLVLIVVWVLVATVGRDWWRRR